MKDFWEHYAKCEYGTGCKVHKIADRDTATSEQEIVNLTENEEDSSEEQQEEIQF